MSQDPPARLPGVQDAKQEGRQQPDSWPDLERPWMPQLTESEAMRKWREGGLKHLEHMVEMKMHNQLLQSLDRQSKAIEEYTKATQKLTIHIGLLIQAMADGEDDTGTGPDMRTLG